LLLAASQARGLSPWRPLLGAGAILFAGFLECGIPYRGDTHPLRGGIGQPDTVVLLAVAGLPLATGVTLGLSYLSALRCPQARPHPGGRPPARVRWHRKLGWVGVSSVLAVAVVAAAKPQFHGDDSIRDDYGNPTLVLVGWRPVVIAGVALAVCLVARLVAGRAKVVVIPLLAAPVSFSVIGAAKSLELLARHSLYLGRKVGTPHVRLNTSLSPWAVGLFAAVSGVAVALFLALPRGKAGAGGPGIAPVVRVLALLLGVAGFVNANYLGRTGGEFVHAVVCLDVEGGAIRWVREGLPGGEGRFGRGNSPATPKPVLDGDRLFA
jgi:hypothetical protein